MFQVPEGFREAGEKGLNDGVFRVPVERDRHGRPARWAMVIASDGCGWEHVSVTLEGERRCPTWEELEAVRRLFWGSGDVVMQLHVAANDHVNVHEFCLHLWRPIGQKIPVPPRYLV